MRGTLSLRRIKRAPMKTNPVPASIHEGDSGTGVGAEPGLPLGSLPCTANAGSTSTSSWGNLGMNSEGDALGWTSPITPTLVNEFRLGWFRD
jgi:hypothetical protein